MVIVSKLTLRTIHPNCCIASTETTAHLYYLKTIEDWTNSALCNVDFVISKPFNTRTRRNISLLIL